MLNVNHLSFAYRKGGPKVLDDLSFQAEQGNLIAILGSNGAGKSTLFKCILNFLQGYDGQICLDGKDIRNLSRREMARLAAYIPQSETPVFNYSVMDTVLMGTTGTLSPLQAPKEAQIEQARNAMRIMGIEHMEACGINELSGGERQLAFLARAIAQNAKLLIMDEPTANLDYGNQQLVLRQVQKMSDSGYTVLMSTHNPEHALQYATHVLALKDHHVLADGPADRVLSEALIRDLYGLSVRIVDVQIDGRIVKSCIPIN